MDILKRIQKFYKYKYGINVIYFEGDFLGIDVNGYIFKTYFNGSEKEIMYITYDELDEYSKLNTRKLDKIISELTTLSKYINYKYTKNSKTYNSSFISLFTNYSKYESNQFTKYE